MAVAALKLNLIDQFGNALRARLLDNGHIQLNGNVWHYTYARLMRSGEIELYDEDGNVTAAVEGQRDACGTRAH